MNATNVQQLLRGACAGNQVAWAKRNGVSAQYVSDVLHGRREPGNAILAALNLRRVVTYVPVGVSDGAQRMVERMGCAFVPRPAQAIEARRAATGTGAVHESAVPKGCAQEEPSP